MKQVLVFITVMFFSSTLLAQTTTWKDDPMHSKLTFTVTHQGLSSISGLFQKFEVTITSAKQDFSDAMFTLSVDMASVNTEVKMRDDDLRSDHFFDITKYPDMTFKSTSIINTTGMKDRFRITGDLTMHGVTKAVTMDVWFRGTKDDPMSKKTKAGIQLKGMINRVDFGVGPANSNDISTDVMIMADGEFIKQ